MEQRKNGDVFLELGLLLIVTGLMVVVAITGVLVVYARESTIASSSALILISAVGILGLVAVVFILLRRLRRLIARK